MQTNVKDCTGQFMQSQNPEEQAKKALKNLLYSVNRAMKSYTEFKHIVDPNGYLPFAYKCSNARIEYSEIEKNLKRIAYEFAMTQVIAIDNVLAHMTLSAEHHSISIEHATNPYGYKRGSLHYYAIRNLKLTKDERASSPELYENSKSSGIHLHRLIAISNYYHTKTIFHYSDVTQPMSMEHLTTLINISLHKMPFQMKDMETAFNSNTK